MATITITFNSLTRSKTISAADVTRVSNAMKAKFALPGSATGQQVLDAFGDWMFQMLKQEALAHERELAANSARVAVADIPLT